VPPTPAHSSKAAAATLLINARRLDAARTHVQAWIQSSPKDAAAYEFMAHICTQQGNVQQALFHAQRATQLEPRTTRLWILLARLEALLNNIDSCLAATSRAIALNPAFTEPYEVAALALAANGRFMEAREQCLKGLTINPAEFSLRTTLANTQLDTGHVEAAAAGLAQLTDDLGDNVHTADVLCNVLNYAPDADPAFVRRAHLNYGRILRRHRPSPPLAFPERRPGPLRIALISPDLRNHSCGFFIEPYFEHHDRQRVELFAYHTNSATDALTARLKGFAAHWRHVVASSDEALAELVRKDNVDIAIDLAGHTRGESLVTMHLRAAPVQLTYLGYPNITGVDAIDARIVDSYTDPVHLEPPATDRAPGAETLIRIDPCFLCFRPPANLPAITPPPSAVNNYITFGSCNAIQKLNHKVLTLWAGLLAAVPTSRLLLKANNLREERLRQEVTDRFVSLGLPRDRLELLGPLPDRNDHLNIYNRIDVALDPFPYNGTTTTCDALCMGVPVITLEGTVHASRVGVSLLTAIGHPQWIAKAPDDYITLAARLAADVTLRAHLRQTLRQTLQASTLCDGPAFARRFTDALETLYKQRTPTPTPTPTPP